MQIITQPLPSLHLLNAQTRPTVGEREEKHESPDHHSQDHNCGKPRPEQTLAPHPLLCGLELPSRLLCSNSALLLNSGRYIFLGFIDDLRFRWLEINIGLDVEDKFDYCAGDQAGGEMCWEIVVQEELATHGIEGEVVSGPTQEEEAGRVI